MKVYAISGLGVDERVFSELTLNFELIPLNWIAPKPKESMSSYARRLSEPIDRNVPCMIIGVSFGGMMAIELSKVLPTEKIILISSASGKSDIPWVFRTLGKTGLLNLVPDVLLKPPPFVLNFVFGVEAPKYQFLLKQIIKDTDVDFLRWAIGQIVKWDNQQHIPNLIRIHGTDDRLLKCPKNEQAITISNAGHFMVMDHASEVSKALRNLIT